MGHWVRVHPSMQGAWVLSLVWEDSTCLEQLSPRAMTTEALTPLLGSRPCSPWLEKALAAVKIQHSRK